MDCSRHSNTLHRPLTREEICKEKNVIEALNKSCLPFDDEGNQEKTIDHQRNHHHHL